MQMPKSFFSSSISLPELGVLVYILTRMRELKHHEQRLLKRVDFLDYKQNQYYQDVQVLQRYYIQI